MGRNNRDYHVQRPAGIPLYSPADADLYVPESETNPLSLILLPAFGIVTLTTGLCRMTGAPILLVVLIALGLYGGKLHFLFGYLSWRGMTKASRDKALGYLILTVILFVLSSYGFYELGNATDVGAVNLSQSPHSDASFLSFLKATASKNTFAIICWVANALIEFVIVIVAMQDHQEREYPM